MRLLIANRGEIAVRIARTARRLGLQTVALVPDSELTGQLPMLADTLVRITESGIFTDINALTVLAHQYGCQLVHPGYGFLSERAAFAQHLADNHLMFAGPRPQHLLWRATNGSRRIWRGNLLFRLLPIIGRRRK